MLSSRFAMWMGWGSEFHFFCNDAYKPTLGIKGVVWIYAGLYVAGAVLTFFIPVHQPRLSQQVSRYTSAAEPTQPL